MYQNFVFLLFYNSQNQVALLRRINTQYGNGCYALPGGKIEVGETASQAVIREAQSNLGITINHHNFEFIHAMNRKCNEAEFFAALFKINSWQGTIVNQSPERHDDLQWSTKDMLPNNTISSHAYALEMIEKKVLYSEHGWEKR